MNVATHLRNHAYSQFGIFEGFYHITKEKDVRQRTDQETEAMLQAVKLVASTPMETNKSLVVVMAMLLEDWPNNELAAFKNAMSWQDKLPKQNRAFDRAVKASLVNADGSIPAIEELRESLSFEINRRLDAGTFK